MAPRRLVAEFAFCRFVDGRDQAVDLCDEFYRVFDVLMRDRGALKRLAEGAAMEDLGLEDRDGQWCSLKRYHPLERHEYKRNRDGFRSMGVRTYREASDRIRGSRVLLRFVFSLSWPVMDEARLDAEMEDLRADLVPVYEMLLKMDPAQVELLADRLEAEQQSDEYSAARA